MTLAQYRLLLVLDAHIRANGVAPSVRDLMRLCGLKSPNTVQRTLGLLAQDGWIWRAPGRARALEVLRLPTSPVAPGRMLEQIADELARDDAERSAHQHESDLEFAEWMLGVLRRAGFEVLPAAGAAEA